MVAATLTDISDSCPGTGSPIPSTEDAIVEALASLLVAGYRRHSAAPAPPPAADAPGVVAA